MKFSGFLNKNLFGERLTMQAAWRKRITQEIKLVSTYAPVAICYQ